MNSIGIIMPTHNRPDLVVHALESLRAQTYTDWIAFVVDDASEKDYSTVRERFAEDERIRFYRLEHNGGVNAARNRALDEAQSAGVPYIALLDDDDAFTPDYLETVHEVARQHPEYGWFWSNTYGDTKPSSREITAVREYDFVDDYIYGKFRGDKTLMLSSATIGNTRFQSKKRNVDWHFFINISKRSKILAFPHKSKRIAYQDGGITKTKKYPVNVYEVVYRFSKHWHVVRCRPLKLPAYRYMAYELIKTPRRLLQLWWRGRRE